MSRKLFMMLLILVGLVVAPAWAGSKWSEGMWRLELSGGPGLDAGNKRDGDLFLKTSAEYEVPVSTHCTLGLRLLPFFVYDQEGRGNDTLYGAGVGFGGRVYSIANEYRGLFAEAGVHVVGHANRLTGNSSNVNFLTGLGVGYHCKADWSMVVRWEHLSNANLSKENAGANCLTLGIGYRF